MGNQKDTRGTPKGARVSPACWGVKVLFGGNQPRKLAPGGSESTHPTAPVFHGNVSRAVRKLASSVSVPHHPTSTHRRDDCALDAALAPSHQPGLCGPHTDGGQKMQSCCPITAIAWSPATRKSENVLHHSKKRGGEPSPEPRCDGGTGCGPCSPQTQLTVSPAAVSQHEGIHVCSLRIFKTKA